MVSQPPQLQAGYSNLYQLQIPPLSHQDEKYFIALKHKDHRANIPPKYVYTNVTNILHHFFPSNNPWHVNASYYCKHTMKSA